MRKINVDNRNPFMDPHNIICTHWRLSCCQDLYRREKIDPATLRARAFLNESFLKESGELILMSLILFLIRVVVGLEELFGSVMDDTLDEIVVLGILICLVLLLYKWARLMDPPKIIMGSQVKLSNKSGTPKAGITCRDLAIWFK
jgi:hypothetical protein